MMIRTALLASALFAGTLSTHAADWYVNDLSTTGDVYTTAVGNDANAGTAAAPFATITQALSAATAGDVIYVDAGTYGSVIITKAVSIRGAQADVHPNVRNDDNETLINGYVAVNPSITGGTTINGCTIRGAAYLGETPGVYVNNNAGNITIAYNRIRRTANEQSTNGLSGVVTSSSGSSSITVQNNEFYGFQNGVYINPNCTTVVVSNNSFSTVRYAARFVSTIGITFDSNTITDAGGIHLRRNGASGISPTVTSISGNSFDVPASLAWVGYIGVYDNTLTVDASNNTFASKLPSEMSLQELFFLENRIHHRIDGPTSSGGSSPAQGGLGLAIVVPNNLYVTDSSLGQNGSSNVQIQRAIDAASTGGTVTIGEGTFNGDININKAITVTGTNRTTTIIRGTYDGTNGGTNATAHIGSGATLRNVTVTRDFGVNVAQWQASTKNQGITIAQNSSGATVEDVLVRDQRNGVYINNAQNATVLRVDVQDSRTGLQIVNNVSGLNVQECLFHNNFTHGIYFNAVGGTLNLTNATISGNSFEGNWFSHWLANGVSPITLTGSSFSCNWFGTELPVVNAAATTEPAYAAQVPAQFGGTTPGAFDGAIRGERSSELNYLPFLTSGVDVDTTFAFQPDVVSCDGVGPISRSDIDQTYFSLAAAIAANPDPSAAVTITVDGVALDESPVVSDADFSFAAINGASLANGNYFVFNTVGLGSSNFSGWPSEDFDTIRVTTNGALAEGTGLVTTQGLLLLDAGTYSISSSIDLATASYTILGQTSGDDCNDTPLTSIVGTSGVILFTSSSAGDRTIRNVELDISGLAARYVSTTGTGITTFENVVFRYDGTRIFGNNVDGKQNDRDVAKFISASAGTIVYGERTIIPLPSLAVGIKGDDGNNATITTNADYSGNGNAFAQNTVTRRPSRVVNPSLNSQFTVDASGSGTRFLSRDINEDIHGGSERTVFLAFRSHSSVTGNRVYYKHGNDVNGLSIWSNGTDLGVDVHSDGSTVTKTLLPIAANTNYIVQVYFNGASDTRRIGIAAYNASGSSAVEYVASADFASASLATPAAGVASSASLGARLGATRVNGTTYLTNGPDMASQARFTDLVVLEASSEATRDQVFCALRNKMLSGGSDNNSLDKPADDNGIAGEPLEPQISPAYPNPAQDYITFDVVADGNDVVTVQIVDMTGRTMVEIFQGAVVHGEVLSLTQDVAPLPNGAFMIIARGQTTHLATPVFIQR